MDRGNAKFTARLIKGLCVGYCNIYPPDVKDTSYLSQVTYTMAAQSEVSMLHTACVSRTANSNHFAQDEDEEEEGGKRWRNL